MISVIQFMTASISHSRWIRTRMWLRPTGVSPRSPPAKEWPGACACSAANSRAGGDCAAGHDIDEVRAVFGAGVDVGVEALVFDGNVLDRVRGEGFRQRRFHFRDAEQIGRASCRERM